MKKRFVHEKKIGSEGTLKKRILRGAAVLLAACVAACFPGGTYSIRAAGGAAEQGEENLTLIKSVVRYEMNYQTKKWEKAIKKTYKYKKAYPVSIKTYDYGQNKSSTVTMKYSFKKNKPTAMEQYESDGMPGWKVTYNSNGSISRMDREDADGSMERIFQYARGDQFFTVVLHRSVVYDPASKKKKATNFMEEVDSISVKLKNGLLKKTINTGLYANWGADEEKTWERFNGTYTANYDRDGILSHTSAVFRMGPSGKDLRFKVTRKDGRVTQVIRQKWGGKWVDDAKFVFTYYKTRTDRQRYAAMINESIMDADNTYYIYNWY